ncbi:MAG: phage protease [Neptuniibacter sp.]
MTKPSHFPKNKLASTIAGTMDFAGFDEWFEIFRAGKQTDSKGREKEFTEADLDSIVANHNADDPAPLVVGHPKTNDPAYGWTAKLKRDGDTLFAKAKDVVSEFEDAVQQRHYRKRSVSITPDGNGGYSLRHIGFLGAMPPAVSGLADMAFSDNEQSVTYEFSIEDAVQESAWGLSSVTQLLRKMREWIISEHDIETADQVMPDYQINSLQHSVTAMNEHLGDEQRFSADNDSQDSDQETQEMSNFSQEDLDKAAKQEKDRADAAEAKLKNMQFQQRQDSAQSLVDSLVTEGKLLPAQTEGLANFMATLAEQEGTFEFSSGDDTVQKSPYDFAEQLLKSLGKQIQTGEDDREESETNSHSYSAPPGYTVDPDRAALHQKALDYQAKHGGEYTDAILKVEQES